MSTERGLLQIKQDTEHSAEAKPSTNSEEYPSPSSELVNKILNSPEVHAQRLRVIYRSGGVVSKLAELILTTLHACGEPERFPVVPLRIMFPPAPVREIMDNIFRQNRLSDNPHLPDLET